MSRRLRKSVTKEDSGTTEQKHSAVHAEHKSMYETPAARKSAGKLLGPKKGGKHS